MFSIDGLASGIDTTSIIDGLLQIQRQQIGQFTARQTGIKSKQAAFAGIESQLASLQSFISRLGGTANNPLQTKQVTSSDESVAIASANKSALPGTYSITVVQLAQREQIATGGFASLDSEITQGTLDIQVGGAQAVTITVDDTNNSLQGLATAINASDAEVTASIVNDGTGGNDNFRLLLTSKESGEANSIGVTNNLAASSGGATQPIFDDQNPLVRAQDARVRIGDIANGITVSESTNQIDSLIPGVTLDLLTAQDDAPITLTVSADTEAATTAVSDFVDGFNNLMSFIDNQIRFDPETEVAGVLLGERSVTTIQNEIRETLTRAVPGLGSNANRLSAIGITFNSEGQLDFSSSTLDRILNGQEPDISIDDVTRMFGLGADSDNAGVQFVLGSAETQPGQIQVDILQTAQQATIEGDSISGTISIVDGEQDFDITVDGVSTSLSIDAGDYTPEQLATELQTAINESSDFTGQTVSVTYDGNALSITSAKYGLSSQVTIDGGKAAEAAGFTDQTDTGQDVVGRFIVDGVAEEATGRGQLLIGDSDNENTADLNVRVTLSDSAIGADVDATLNITSGFASELSRALDGMLETDGRLDSIDDVFEDQIASVQTSIDRLNAQFEAQQQSLISEFVALESTISELQTLGSFIGSQLGTLSGLGL